MGSCGENEKFLNLTIYFGTSACFSDTTVSQMCVAFFVCLFVFLVNSHALLPSEAG